MNSTEKNSNRNKVIFAKEILTNLKLSLASVVIGLVSYPIWYVIKEPDYIPQGVLDEKLPIVEKEKMDGSSHLLRVGWKF